MPTGRAAASTLITGATGFLGMHLGREMLARGMEYAVLARSQKRAKWYLDHSVEVCFADVQDGDACARAVRGRKVVIHLAAATDISSAAINRRVNIDGLQNILDACRSNGIGHFVFVSSTCAGRAARDAYGETKRQGEERVKQAGLEFTIFRPTMIYGKGSKEFGTFVNVIRHSPMVPLIGSGKHLIQPVYIGDAVKVIIDVIGHRPSYGRTYDLAGVTSISFEGFVHKVAATLGLKRKRILHLPVVPLLYVARVLGKVATQVPITVDQVLAFVQDTEVDITPLGRDLDFSPTPLDVGLRRALIEDLTT